MDMPDRAHGVLSELTQARRQPLISRRYTCKHQWSAADRANTARRESDDKSLKSHDKIVRWWTCIRQQMWARMCRHSRIETFRHYGNESNDLMILTRLN